MVIKFTKEQMNSAPMPPREFAKWYVSEIMTTEFPHFVRDLYPHICEQQTRNGLLYARHFGIMRPDLQAQFMTIMWALGPNFFEVEEFGEILSDTSMTEDAKIDALYAVSDRAGGMAAQRANDLYWYPWRIKNNILGLKEDPELFDDDDDDDDDDEDE
ncbi:hypothetical protein SAMN04487972_109107 [Paracoccus halophilus]|nr:hypothetical protein [Paracoccus halophilus]SFA52398.1 hypothetical protein SAMN04487972_109107 [Paracoccus halophilus]